MTRTNRTHLETPNLTLTDQEICYLYLLLSGKDCQKIETERKKTSVNSYCSKTIYQYTRILTGEKISDFARVPFYLMQQYTLKENKFVFPKELTKEKIQEIMNILKYLDEIL